jgi:hypothetical protein
VTSLIRPTVNVLFVDADGLLPTDDDGLLPTDDDEPLVAAGLDEELQATPTSIRTARMHPVLTLVDRITLTPRVVPTQAAISTPVQLRLAL